MKFHLLNVFSTDEKNSGNQLAVVLPEAQVTSGDMQSIAKDFNFSETVFIYDHYYLRIFTPQSELPFAGHPSIGASWLVSQETKKKNFSLEVPLGVLAIEAEAQGSKLTFPGTPKIRSFDGDLNHVLKHCSVDSKQVHVDQVRMVSSGPEFIVMPLKSHAALKNATPPLGTKDPLKCYFIFQEDPETFYVRMFAPAISVTEDPATGSAACALAGFAREVLDIKAAKVRVFQGAEMKRPSEINLEWNASSIQLAGKVTQWGSGKL